MATGTKTCVAAREDNQNFQIQNASWANVLAGIGTSGFGPGVFVCGKFGPGTFTCTNSLIQFGTNVGGATLLAAELRLTSNFSSVDGDGFSWGVEYAPSYGGGQPDIGDYNPTLVTSIIGLRTVASFVSGGGNVAYTFPISDLSGINTSGFTSLRLGLTGTAAPTADNQVNFYGVGNGVKPDPILLLTYAVPGFVDSPVTIYGRGAA